MNSKNLQEEKRAFNLQYIKSLRGVVPASQFRVLVKYLWDIDNKSYENLKTCVTTKITHNHAEVRELFFNYIDNMRSRNTLNDEFEFHVSRLREYSEINVDKGKKYRYNVLFNEIKDNLWQVVPFKTKYPLITENSYIERICTLFKEVDYEEATLSDVLTPLSLIDLVCDCNIELVDVMKKILVIYHPDKNKNKNAEEIFILFNENVYKPVTVLFEEFEKYTNCSYMSCPLDEFLSWQLREIKEIRSIADKDIAMGLLDRENKILAVYKHLLSRQELPGDLGYSVLDERFKWERPAGTFTMENYRTEKEVILQLKDKIICLCKELLNKCFRVARLKSGLNNGPSLAVSFYLESSTSSCMKNIRALEAKLYKTEIELKNFVSYFIPLFEPMIEKYHKKISYLKEVTDDKINFSEKCKSPCEWDNVEKIKFAKYVRKAKLDIFVEERRLNSYTKRVYELEKENEIMKMFLEYLNVNTANKWSFNIKNLWQSRSFQVDKLININDYNCVAYECVGIIEQFKSIKLLIEKGKWQKVISEQEKLENCIKKFNTEKEKLKTSKKLDKKELMFCINEKKNMEMQVIEEIKAKERAENQNKIFEDLQLRVKKNMISLDDIKKLKNNMISLDDLKKLNFNS